MNCTSPVVLKNGEVVPCGKCDLCRSSYRNEWSIRLQMHAAAYDRMPMFCCLTYNDDNLTWTNEPTLVQSDVKLFIKRYKDKHNLYNTAWSFFGCGEYGDAMHRPHYHLLLFGDRELEHVFQRSKFEADDYLNKSWRKGFCDVGIAQWSGIHYVTKYILKQIDGVNDYDDVVPQFTLCSKGIGNAWFSTQECAVLRYKIQNFVDNKAQIYEEINNAFDFEGDIMHQYYGLKKAVDVCDKYLPKLQTVLPSGRVAPLPRYFRRRLIGSFQHFKDNPLWFPEYLKKLLQSVEYYREFGDYDDCHVLPMSAVQSISKLRRMHQKYLENRYKKQFK